MLDINLAWVLVPNYVVLVIGSEGGGPHHMQGCHTRFKEASGFDFEYSSNIQWRPPFLSYTYI